MQFLDINRNSLEITPVRVSAAAIIMIVVLLLDRPAAADESAVAPTIMPQQQLDEAFQDFADRMALDRRLQRLEQQRKTLLNTAPTIVSQQPPIADPPQDFADRIALDQRLQRLELQIQSLLDMQIQILLNTRKRAVQTRAETFPKSWVLPKQTTKNYHYRRRHELDGTASSGEPVDASLAARRGITNASGCPASVPCVERRTAPFTASPAEPEYDEAGAEKK